VLAAGRRGAVGDKKPFLWLLALPIGTLGGCLLAMVFTLVGVFLVDDSGDIITIFMYGGFFYVGIAGAIVGIIAGLLLGLVAWRKWGGWGAVLAGLASAVISGLGLALLFITLLLDASAQ
jgi:hypothetical protein